MLTFTTEINKNTFIHHDGLYGYVDLMSRNQDTLIRINKEDVPNLIKFVNILTATDYKARNMITNWNKLLGARILGKYKGGTSVNEYTVVEISPSGEYISLKDSDNSGYIRWVEKSEFIFLEELEDNSDY